jgi:hypothetical protein
VSVSESSAYKSVCLEGTNEGLGMLVNLVGRGIASKGVDVCIVSVYHDPRLDTSHGRWKELTWPEDVVVGRPCLSRVAVEAVYEDNAVLALA